MNSKTVIRAFQDVGRPVFTTREIAALRSGSVSSTSQTLSKLARQGIVEKVTRGIWCLPSHPYFSPFTVVPFLLPGQRSYVSFISALHLQGIIEQVPQVIYLATTGRGRMVRTGIGSYSFHQLSPGFFCGFDWYGRRHDFLIARPEKALVDCLYLSSRKGRQFASFPELHFGSRFSFRQALKWANRVSDNRIRSYVLKRLKAIKENESTG